MKPDMTAATDDPTDWRARALISASALRHNLAVVRKCAPKSRVMAVLKSNAYGHGMAAVCAALADGVDAIAVATMKEGVACRAVNSALPVVVLSGLLQPASLDLCRRYRLQPVLHTPQHVDWAADYRGAAIAVWLKIDSGMNRLGIAPSQTAAAIARLQANPRIETLRLMSHLSCADDAADDTTPAQQQHFAAATAAYDFERSLANSAGVMAWRDTHYDWVRPGIMLYDRGSPVLPVVIDDADAITKTPVTPSPTHHYYAR